MKRKFATCACLSIVGALIAFAVVSARPQQAKADGLYISSHGFSLGISSRPAAPAYVYPVAPPRAVFVAPPPPPPPVVIQQPRPIYVQQPTVVQQPVVVQQQPVVVQTVQRQVWVPGRYVDQIQPNGTVVRVWQPGHYEVR